MFLEGGDGARGNAEGASGRKPDVKRFPEGSGLRLLEDLDDGNGLEVLKVLDAATVLEAPVVQERGAVLATPEINGLSCDEDEGATLVKESSGRRTAGGLWKDLFEDDGVRRSGTMRTDLVEDGLRDAGGVALPPVEQLAHEAGVWVAGLADGLDHLVDFLEAALLLPHQIEDEERRRARDTLLAVDKDL